MLLVAANRLKPGMATAAPVLHPRQSATRLVQPGVELTAEMIRRLGELQVPHVWVKHPLLQDLDALVSSKIPECRRAIYDTVRQGFDSLQNRVITTDDYRRYRSVIAGLVDQLLGRNGRAGALAERLFSDGDELADHSANVAYLAVTVAMRLDAYVTRQRNRANAADPRDLTNLGVGAILHDIGKLHLDREARRAHEVDAGPQTDYREHVETGFRLLRERVDPTASTIALHHHQRWDGAGWPDMTELTHGRRTGGLNGQRIHVFARIVAVANTFDQLTVADEGPRPAVQALHVMQTDRYAGAFDPFVLDAFLRAVPPFPLGCEVILSDGTVAAVTELNEHAPCQPVVRPLDESYRGHDIDLSREHGLCIVEAQGHRVERWLYALPAKADALAAAYDETILGV